MVPAVRVPCEPGDARGEWANTVHRDAALAFLGREAGLPGGDHGDLVPALGHARGEHLHLPVRSTDERRIRVGQQEEPQSAALSHRPSSTHVAPR